MPQTPPNCTELGLHTWVDEQLGFETDQVPWLHDVVAEPANPEAELLRVWLNPWLWPLLSAEQLDQPKVVLLQLLLDEQDAVEPPLLPEHVHE